MLAAEGAAFELSKQLNATGLVGSYTSTVHWGDGTSSTGNVIGSQPNGPLNVRFVYPANDTFFSGANIGRRTVLQAAADSIIERFTDDLAAIRPNSLLQWTARTINPSNGQVLRVPNLSVAANELVIYVGARNLSGNNVGEGAPGTYEFAAVNGLTQQQINQIVAFRNTVITRGESGVTGSAPTDYATWGGTLSFDSGTNFYFGLNANGLGDNQVDFFSVAAHELLHILGFGVQFQGATSTWQHLTRSGTYLGAKGNAAFPGGGQIPLTSDRQHVSQSALFNGTRLLMNPEITRGQRFQLTPVDLAVLDDLGWTVNQNTATVTATHVYPDDGNYSAEVVLSGSRVGTVTQTQNVNVTNVPPTLVAATARTAFAGDTVSIIDIGSISDPGYRNTNINPPTVETFSYSINWRDSAEIDRGAATIDRHGTASVGVTTLASFDGSHVYSTPGIYDVELTVVDDDGGTRSTAFPITIIERPRLLLTFANPIVRESAGAAATRLTVQRSGPATQSDQTITLISTDETELSVPASLTIRRGETSASVLIDAVDDNLLDGTQSVVVTASGTGLTSGEAILNVSDHETLDVAISANQLIEDQPGSVTLTVSRSNIDVANPLSIALGGRQSQIDIGGSVTIPTGSRSVAIPLSPIDDDDHEPILNLVYTFTAAGYVSDEVAFSLIDDEPPLFQNPVNRFDIDGNGETTAADALRVINELSRRIGERNFLDPSTSQPHGVFYDANGDYFLTALDALIVINELSRQRPAVAEAEAIVGSVASPVIPIREEDEEDEDPHTRVFYH